MHFLTIIGFGSIVYLADFLASFLAGFLNGFIQSRRKTASKKISQFFELLRYALEFMGVVAAIARFSHWGQPRILFVALGLIVANMASYCLQHIFMKRVPMEFWWSAMVSFLLCLPLGLYFSQ